MKTKAINIEKARFDTRLPKDQKEFFERAARLGGYRSLTDFVVLTVQEKATEIINKMDQILASQKDSEIFFDAITNPSKPNQDLVNALNDYNSLSSK